MTTKRYAIFQKRYAALGADDYKKEYEAVPVEYISNGIFIPASHYEIDPSELTELEADSPEHAIEEYEESLGDSFM